MKGAMPKILILLLLLTLGAAGWAGYRIRVLKVENAGLREQSVSLERKMRQSVSKLDEQRAVADRNGSAKANLDGELRVAEARIHELTNKLAADKARLQAEADKLRSSGETAATSHRQEMEKSKDAVAQWSAKYEELRADSSTKLRERDERIASLTGEKQKLNAKLETEKHEHEYCRQANGRFADLSKELLEKFEKKGVFDTLKRKELFTQLSKVELEKLIQDFKDKIDNGTL
jgi:chromosome segregation ATPase